MSKLYCPLKQSDHKLVFSIIYCFMYTVMIRFSALGACLFLVPQGMVLILDRELSIASLFEKQLYVQNFNVVFIGKRDNKITETVYTTVTNIQQLDQGNWILPGQNDQLSSHHKI